MKTIKQILTLIIINNFFIIQATIADNVETLEPIIVTGSLIPTKLKQTGAAVTVITSKEIEESKTNNLAEILTGSTGFQVYESGGPYSLSRAFLRGNETDHTLVLINGMKIVDPATGRGSVDLERITLSGVERIEVIRGSQSALYGSEAIGGVINIILKRGGDKYKKYLNLESSNRLDKTFSTGISGSIKKLFFSSNFEHSEGPGISAAEKSLGYEENDSYNIDSGQLTLDYEINSDTDISLTSRIFTSEIEEDKAPLGPIVDADRQTNLLDWQSQLSMEKKYDLFYMKISGSTSKARRYSLNEDRKFRRYIADLNIGKLQFVIPVNDSNTVVIGTSTERSHMDTQDENNAYDFKTSNTSIYFSYAKSYLENFYIDLSYRQNFHDLYGKSNTYRLASSYIIHTSGYRIHSSFGTGYRAPTLDEIYGTYGSLDIKEENSRSRDLGIEFQSKNKKVRTDITFFSTQIDNLIGFGPAPGYLYQNQGSAKTNGIEFFINYIFRKNLEINTTYNFLTTNNNGKSLSRRRKHSGRTSIKWVIDRYPEFTSYSSIEYHSKARDDAFTGAKLSGYALIHSNLTYVIDSKTTIHLKVENFLDQKYHLADTAGTYGRTISLGMNLLF